LPSPLNGEQAGGLKGFEVAANIALVEAKIDAKARDQESSSRSAMRS
jgi:hypothetical protein